MADDLTVKLQELNGKVDALTQTMAEIRTTLREVLTVDKMNNQLTAQSANYLCKAVGEMLGVSRYMLVSENVNNGVAESKAEDVRRFNELISLIWPKSVSGFPKIRLGNGGDGGYVLVQDFDSIETVYSLGICDDVSFDLDITRHGQNVRDVWQYDDSVDRPPVAHEKFHFQRKRINTVADLGAITPNSLLKIDIEGSEWDFFLSCGMEELGKFRQIACEFHDFSLFRTEGWYARARSVLEKLNWSHQAVHIHGNNIVPPVWTGDRYFPSVLEVTYVRRADYSFSPSAEAFPGQYDCPSSILFPEIKLNRQGVETGSGVGATLSAMAKSGRLQL